MAEPTQKAPEINKLINSLTGGDREAQIRTNVCAPPPIGCGVRVIPEVDPMRLTETPATFRDAVSLKEYRISGLCQHCQDAIFGAGDD